MIHTKSNLKIKGMHCAACASRIEKVISKIDGVTEIHVNLTTETGRVQFNENRTSLSNIIQKINKIGFGVENVANDKRSNDQTSKGTNVLLWKFIFSALLTIPLAWSMLAHFTWASFIYIPALFMKPVFQLIIATPIQFIIGFQFYERAWKALKNGSTNMDVLVVLSTSAAFFYSHFLTVRSLQFVNLSEPIVLYFDTSAFIITFILLGRLLEANTKSKTTESIKKLYQLQTKTATLYKNGRKVTIPNDQIMPGDIILLNPGEKVPIDGQIIKGNSVINESLLTGEGIPIEKKFGDLVYAGTINHNGALQIKVTKQNSETTLAQIIQVVEDAQSSKAPIQHIADKITGTFVPIIILIAITTFGVWYIYLQPNNFSEALGKMIAVLIIACPCALGLATPTSVMVGSGRAAQRGILFKEGKFIELLSGCKTVVLDKTGTLTKGVPQVTDIYTEQLNQQEFLEIIGTIEQNSDHPVAKAIVNKVKTKVRFVPIANQVVSIPGYGMKASVLGKEVIIANPNYFFNKSQSVPIKADQVVRKLESEGKTVMITFIDSLFAGIVAVADELKTSSNPAVSRLQQMNMDICMLTGDNRNSAIAVAKRMGIRKFQAEVAPSDKAAIIKQLQLDGNKVIMVGDGINDAPALVVANVGVAMGTGSDIAIESGDVTIIKGDLNRFIDAVKISQKTMVNIKQNLLWAFLYNVVMIPFAMFGFLAPWLAGIAMAFSSVSVVLNSLRLKRVKI